MAILSLAIEIFRHTLFSRRSSALVRVISWLCILGVGLGVAALVVVLSVMNGFDDAIRRRLVTVQPHLIVQAPVSQLSKVSDLIEANSKHNKALVSPFQTQDVLVRTSDGYFSGAQAKGLSRSSIESMLIESRRLKNEEIRARQGGSYELPESADIDLGSGEILIGIDLARSLEIFEGDEIVAISPESLLLPSGLIPQYEKVKVRGFIRTNIPEVDGSAILYEIGKSLKRLQKDSGQESGIEVRLQDPYSFSSLRSVLESKSYAVESWEDRNKALFYSLKMEKLAMSLFLGLSVLIASFSILTALVLLVTHKRKEIGVLMAMGLSRKKAQAILTGVGLVLSSFGVLGGTFFGLFLCWFIDTFPKLFRLPAIYYDTRIPVLVDPQVIVSLLIVSLVVAILSSWLPARYITRGTPSALLRPLAQTNLPDTNSANAI